MSNISFATIPNGLRKPGDYIEFNTSKAVNTLPGNAQNVLFCGGMLSSGAATPNTLYTVFSSQQAAVLFGYGSILHLMVIAGLNANNYLNLQCIGLADAATGGVAASFTATLTGTATSVGVLTLSVGAQNVAVGVNVGDTAAVIAGNLAAALANLPNLPVTAAVVGGVVTLTAKHKGTLGSQLVISASALAGYAAIGGVTVAVAAGTAGATDPVLNTALTTAFASGVNIVVSAWNDSTNLTALKTWLENVSSAIEQRGAVGVAAVNSTLSSATTLAGDLDEGRLTLALLPGAVNQSYEIAAAYGAVIAASTDPAQPLNYEALTGILPVSIVNNLSRTMQENALANGVTPLQNGPDNVVQIVRAITTYTLNQAGVPDPALLDLGTIRSLDYVRLLVRTRMLLRFPNAKLMQRTIKNVRSEILDVLYELEKAEVVQNVAANAPSLLLQINGTDPTRLDAQIPANVVSGLMIFAAVIDLIL